MSIKVKEALSQSYNQQKNSMICLDLGSKSVKFQEKVLGNILDEIKFQSLQEKYFLVPDFCGTRHTSHSQNAWIILRKFGVESNFRINF